MSVLLVSHEDCLEHLTAPGHPERPGRLTALASGLSASGLGEALIPLEPELASPAAILAVHDPTVVDRIDALAAVGGGSLDPDTSMSEGSWRASMLAAGAGLTAVDALRSGSAGAAFCAVRPPGHHATPARSMGFCLINNIAVTATALADAGERVLIVDYDAHHGNGTQDVFYSDPRVLFVSYHQYPLYPGTGSLDEGGTGRGSGTTINLPLPAGATGDVYAAGWHEVVLPAVTRFGPTWLLISAGFDAHRDDPLTDMGLSSGDFGALTAELVGVVPAGRTIAFLEGGYDFDALAASAAACLAALAGVEYLPEAPTAGGPGSEVVAAARVARPSS